MNEVVELKRIKDLSYQTPETQPRLTLYDVRMMIEREGNVLQNLLAVANGKIPKAWEEAHKERQADLPYDKQTKLDLSMSAILQANYALLARTVPELSRVEFADTKDEDSTAAESRKKFYDAINRRLNPTTQEGISEEATAE